MSLLKHKTTPTDPSNFLWALRNKITKDRGSPFSFNSQEDVPETLQTVIDELKGISLLAGSIISSTLQTSVTCNVCLCCNLQEEKFDIITLPLTLSVSESIKKFLEAEELTGANRWFCTSCKDLINSTKKIKFIKVGTIVIFQLQLYIMFRGNPIKDNRKVTCSSNPLKIPVCCENTISFSASFSLQATINHSGTLQVGHCWSFKKDKHGNKWLKCNDTSVYPVQQKSLIFCSQA